MDTFLRGTWKICRWLWAVVIIALAIAFLANVLAGKPADAFTNAFANAVTWVWTSNSLPSILSILAILVFLGFSFISGIYQLLYGADDSQPFQEQMEDIKALTKAQVSNIHQLSTDLHRLIEFHVDHLTRISNSLQATSISLKILEQQVVHAPIENLAQKVIQQDRRLDILTKTFDQEISHQQKMLTELQANNLPVRLKVLEQQLSHQQKIITELYENDLPELREREVIEIIEEPYHEIRSATTHAT